jgi:hypothetical protein
MSKKKKETPKTNIEVLLENIDQQLLVKLLDSLIKEQSPTQPENQPGSSN